MTAQTHRHLVNLEILISDIEMLAPGDLATAPHIRLLDSIRRELTALEASAINETQQGFQQLVGTTTLKQGLKDKRMLTIYNRLLGYILQHWRASTKIDEIIDSQFDNHADERLELLRTKSIRAKSQCKTIMLAMGNCDANYFLTLFGLQQEAWLVQV
ncbi:hypothetical protein [Alteromonas sp. C1M14]|uniref:hypothetical protein n=1 Tax=Alteromonas sp. C1M14 TaxID=2841567 RepID=UPI001C0947E1|nr:hypothetical protein [Alteromonas sp. C1M14]MBU2977114.1 hypothetical protein [Alteromonas sp. C1M14]